METTAKIRFSEETDFVVINYDQSDIEEIDEHSESDSTNNLQQTENNTPSSNQRDDSHSNDDDETNEMETSQGNENQRLERRKIHGNKSEGLSNDSDSEPVGTSLEDCVLDTCKHVVLSGEDDGICGDGDYEEDDCELSDDEQEIKVRYLIEDENDVEQIMDLRTIKRNRAYRHTPNSNINLRLNLIVCFAITAGIFLGLGNYIGWSANWTKTKAMMTLNNNHIVKLKNLQDDLVACMNAQSKVTLQLSSQDHNIYMLKKKEDNLLKERVLKEKIEKARVNKEDKLEELEKEERGRREGREEREERERKRKKDKKDKKDKKEKERERKRKRDKGREKKD